ncbi:MAG: hypothetical protein NVSMB12_19770 [Acidimicrobiales bacterium]
MTVLPGGSDLEVLGDGELEAERDFLLGSLDDLEAERVAGDIDDHDYHSLRDSYTARAAAVLRVIDTRRVTLAGAPTGPPRASRPVRSGGAARRGTALIVVGALGFAAVAGLLVMRTAGQRLPGDNVSGSTPTSPVAKLLAQAQAQVQSDHLLDAVQTYEKVISIDPRNAEALAYKGWLLRLAGHQGNDAQVVDRGLESIRAAEAVAPAYPDAHFFAGETLLRDKADPKGAIGEFEQFLADHPPPDYAPLVQRELESARAQLAGTAPAPPAGTAPAGTAPAGTAPAGTAPAGTAPAGTSPAGTPPVSAP